MASRLVRLLAQLAVVDVTDRDRPPGEGTAEPGAEFKRQAGVERSVDRSWVEASVQASHLKEETSFHNYPSVYFRSGFFQGSILRWQLADNLRGTP
jgi:hypothetical protein